MLGSCVKKVILVLFLGYIGVYNEYFYASHRFHSFEDFKAQLAGWNRRYNNFPMKPLHWRSLNQLLYPIL